LNGDLEKLRVDLKVFWVFDMKIGVMWRFVIEMKVVRTKEMNWLQENLRVKLRETQSSQEPSSLLH
jgi:hypothetical protein